MDRSRNNLQGHSRPHKGKSCIDLPDNYVILDIETTGLDPTYDNIIEVSALKIHDRIIVDELSTLIRPETGFIVYDDKDRDYCMVDHEKVRYVDEFITNLTGITNKMLETAPVFYDVASDLLLFLGDHVIIGHNVNFDVNFLYDAFMKTLNTPLKNDFIDTLRLARKLLPELKHHRLVDLTGYFDLDYSGAHRATKDCKSTLSCYLKLKEIAETKYGIDVLKKMFVPKSYKIDVTNIKSDEECFDETSPFYKKTCVFTGTLDSFARKDAMQKVVNCGGSVSETVGKNTNYLIVGSFDYVKAVKGNKSNKIKRAESLIKKGEDISIISENVFLDMLYDK